MTFDGEHDCLDKGHQMKHHNQVRVYRNLNNGKLSVQMYVKGKGWRVNSHSEAVIIDKPKFVVYEKGRQRVLKERRKNVHAYVEGILVCRYDTAACCPHFPAHDGNPAFGEARYNPYESGCWLDENGSAICSADRAVISMDGKVTVRH